jgi:selenocysteine lyase/cysteine desulfurase
MNEKIDATVSESNATDCLESSYDSFLTDHPSYSQTDLLDSWRSTEYKRLDAQQQIYLDYTGGSLYGSSQLETHFEMLNSSVLGNPHSLNPTSLAMTEMVEDTREYVLNYFNAADEYIAIFTLNASGALKHVGESYPFAPDGQYLLSFDNHNSVNGIREFAKAKGAAVSYTPLTMPDLRLDQESLENSLNNKNSDAHSLFAFPAQSNFSGVKHPLELIPYAQEKGWDVLLDAAAFVAGNPLDLQLWKPEFVCISFYKMFGYPTGIGALLVRKTVLDKLSRPWFAGGTVDFATVQVKEHYLTPNEAAFEDGTLNYLDIPAVKIGLQHLEKAGVEMIGDRIHCLTSWLIEHLLKLTHSNGKSMVRIYGPTDMDMRGGTIALNFYDPNERMIDYKLVEQLANDQGISIRTGCFCNPGVGETAEDLTKDDLQAALQSMEVKNLQHFVKFIHDYSNKSAGAIRVSIGIASNFADIYRFMHFAAAFLDKTDYEHVGTTCDITTEYSIRDGT